MLENKRETAFKEAYNALNKAQKEAVDTTQGPVLVVAGPGTGKTQILTLRIANIIFTGSAAPEDILALTFTESGARAMRDRLRQYLGNLAYRVPIYTFHGFAEHLITIYPEYFERLIGGSILNDWQKINLLTNILETGNYRRLRPHGNPGFYVKPLVNQLSKLKREYVSPDDLADILSTQEKEQQQMEQTHQKGPHKGKLKGDYLKLSGTLEKNRELLNVYRSYEAALRADKQYDFEDMLIEMIKALSKTEEFLRIVQETYQYVLADEHQDVNGSQNRLLDILVSFHDNPNLFVVGDEKQAIYRFQGASLENFLYFEERFPGTKIISLTDNYRSGQTILDAAHSLITSDNTAAVKELRVPLKAKLREKGVVFRAHFPHQHLELAWLVKDIKNYLKEGTPPTEIAVIARTNEAVSLISEVLTEADISTTASVDTELFSHPLIKLLRALIITVAKPEEESALLTLMHAPYWGLSLADLALIATARSRRESLPALIGNKNRLTEIGVTDVTAVLKIHCALNKAKQSLGSQSLSDWLRELVHHSGLLAYALKTDALRNATLLRQFYDQVAELEKSQTLKSLVDLSRILDSMEVNRIAPTVPYLTAAGGVVVLTAHKAKGLEFERVYITNLTDRLWSGRLRSQQFSLPLTKGKHETSVIDDERRLFYVALTRAKKQVTLLGSDVGRDGRELSPSRFLEEIVPASVTTIDLGDFNRDFSPADTLKPAARAELLDPALLKTLFLRRGFSVTALNNYRKSPWEYFYRNLLRIPEAQPLHFIYGNAMHAIMAKVVTHLAAAGHLPKPAEYSAWLTNYLNLELITTEDFTALHEKGLAGLTGYLADYGDALPTKSKQEFMVSVVLETGLPDLPEIPLKGVIDRVDIEDGKPWRVVDYKTGKPKTKGQIEGSTKNSDGEYKRQLVFYKLLFSLLDQTDALGGVPTEYELVFLEPNQRGEYKNYVTTITDGELTALTEEIISAAEAIVSGRFLTTPCDPAVCNYCDLVDLLPLKKASP